MAGAAVAIAIATLSFPWHQQLGGGAITRRKAAKASQRTVARRPPVTRAAPTRVPQERVAREIRRLKREQQREQYFKEQQVKEALILDIAALVDDDEDFMEEDFMEEDEFYDAIAPKECYLPIGTIDNELPPKVTAKQRAKDRYAIQKANSNRLIPHLAVKGTPIFDNFMTALMQTKKVKVDLTRLAQGYRPSLSSQRRAYGNKNGFLDPGLVIEDNTQSDGSVNIKWHTALFAKLFGDLCTGKGFGGVNLEYIRDHMLKRDTFAIYLGENILDTPAIALGYTKYVYDDGSECSNKMSYEDSKTPPAMNCPKGGVKTMYIDLICASSSEAVKLKGGLMKYLLNFANRIAKEDGYEMLGLRAASDALIGAYDSQGYTRQVNQCKDSKHLGGWVTQPWPNIVKTQYNYYSLRDPTTGSIIDIDALTAQGEENEGFWMSKCVNPSSEALCKLARGHWQ